MRRLTATSAMLLGVIVACAGTAAAQESRRAPAKHAAPQLTRYQVAAGTALLLTMRTPLDSSTALVDDQVEAVLWSPVIQDDLELIPAGSVAIGRVREVLRASDKTPAGRLTLTFTVVEHAETRSRAMIKTQDVVITAPPSEPPRGRFKRRPKPVDASIKAGTAFAAMTTAPLVVWIPKG
jgi:hypothetical protein